MFFFLLHQIFFMFVPDGEVKSIKIYNSSSKLLGVYRDDKFSLCDISFMGFLPYYFSTYNSVPSCGLFYFLFLFATCLSSSDSSCAYIP